MKKIVRIQIATFVVLMLSGCAAVGVFPTSDPVQKINDAYAMLAQGRAPRAKQFASEALALYESKKDISGVARAHSVLGDINRDGKSRDLPNYSESKIHYSKAAEIYQERKEHKWESYNLYAFASAQNLEGNVAESCKSLAHAKKVFAKAPDYNSLTESFEKAGAFSYQSFPALEKAFGCKQK